MVFLGPGVWRTRLVFAPSLSVEAENAPAEFDRSEGFSLLFPRLVQLVPTTEQTVPSLLCPSKDAAKPGQQERDQETIGIAARPAPLNAFRKSRSQPAERAMDGIDFLSGDTLLSSHLRQGDGDEVGCEISACHRFRSTSQIALVSNSPDASAFAHSTGTVTRRHGRAHAGGAAQGGAAPKPAPSRPL